MNKIYTVKFNSCGELVVVSELCSGVKKIIESVVGVKKR